MKSISNFFDKRIKFLLNLKAETEQALLDAPKGTLRISHNKKRIQYFQIEDPKDSTGSYIRQQNLQLAQALAQKDYNKKVLRAANQELLAIRKYCATVPKLKAEDIYEAMNEDRRDLVTPFQESEARFVQNWLSVPYQGKGFDESAPRLYTAKEERVRSKSEIIIADALERESIPYRYECPLSLPGTGKIYPDFTVLHVQKRKELYWEHLGMMDDPAYVENALLKIATYEKNGIFPGENLILTYETKETPINQKHVLLIIRHYLQS